MTKLFNSNMTTEKSAVEEKRSKVIDEVEQLRRRVETEIGTELNYVRSPLNIARENLLTDGEFNYNVRNALIQLQHAVEGSESDCIGTLESIEMFRDKLAEKAGLPPRDQVTR